MAAKVNCSVEGTESETGAIGRETEKEREKEGERERERARARVRVRARARENTNFSLVANYIALQACIAFICISMVIIFCVDIQTNREQSNT